MELNNFLGFLLTRMWIDITKLISLDSSSTKTGWAIFENGILNDYGVIDLHNNRDSESRLYDMVQKLWDILEHHKPDIIVVEKLNEFANRLANL